METSRLEMSSLKRLSKISTFSPSPSASPMAYETSTDRKDLIHNDVDTIRLAQMGYTQDMRRRFTVTSLLGLSFSLANSWFGISTSMVTGIRSGGTALIIYGIPWISFVSLCVAASLSELASAMPSSGGQYFWAHELAPRKYATFAAYLTGWLAFTGAIFTCASVGAALTNGLIGAWASTHPHHDMKAWHVLAVYEAINFFSFLFNCFGRVLPTVANCTLCISLVSFFVILVTVPAAASEHAKPSFVFANFVNKTGWSSDGFAYIIGLIGPNWIFSCLDSATHMAEEVANPERSIPTAIFCTVFIGFITSWTYCISMFFSVSDAAGILKAHDVPLLALFEQALQSKAGALVLHALIMVTGIGCLVACHTWLSRLCWSFARDGGIPGSKYLLKINPILGIPFAAHTVGCIIVGLLGLLFLASVEAFASMISACIVLLYASYVIPIICLLHRGRDDIRHGPFWLGKVGLFCNWAVLLWTLFCLVVYSFPSGHDVDPQMMNYVSVVYAVVVMIVFVDWFARGGRHFRTQAERHEHIEATFS